MQPTSVSTDIILLDIAGFSKLSDEGQLASVLLLNEELRRFLKRLPVRSYQKVHQIVLDVIPSGDGFFIILNQAFAGYGPLCALSIRSHMNDGLDQLDLAGIHVCGRFPTLPYDFPGAKRL